MYIIIMTVVFGQLYDDNDDVTPTFAFSNCTVSENRIPVIFSNNSQEIWASVDNFWYR